jgi:hypothetical protein
MAEERGFRSGWSSSKDNEEQQEANSNLADSNSIIAGNRRRRNDDDRSDLERWRDTNRPVYGQEPIDPSVVKLTQPIKMFGVYVESFSVSVGYGAESSTMQMTLVEDPNNFTQKTNDNGVPLYKGTDSITGREIETTEKLSCDLNGENCTENEKIMIADPIVLHHEVQVLDDDGLPEKNAGGSDKFQRVEGFPPIGTVCQFALQGMEFVGVFQRYNYAQGLDGRKYEVTFESPAKILDGVQVILKSFEGTAFQLLPQTYFYPSEGINFTSQINNVYNPFGIKENFAWGGMFGYSDVNDQGFPVRDKADDPTNIQDKGLLTLIEEISRSVYTYDNPNGASADTTTNQDDEELIGGPINFGLNRLTIDFGKLKELVPDGYRMSGEVSSINAIMQDLTEICLHDYVSTIDPVLVTVPSGQTQAGGSFIVGTGSNVIEKVFKNGVTPTVFDDDGNVVGPVIRFSYQDKSEQPKPGVVAELVEDSKKGNTLISANNGKEYADVTTQKLMIGGDATRVWEVGIGDLLPALGKDANGNYLVGTGTGPGGLCPIRLPDGSTYVASNFELRCASAGRDVWGLFQQSMKAVGNPALQVPRTGFSVLNPAGNGFNQARVQRRHNAASLVASFNSHMHGDLIDVSKLGNSAGSVDAYFESIVDASRNYSGSTYLIPLPVEPGGIDNNLRYKNNFDIEAAWEIAESAFDPAYRVEDITGYDDEGRLKACAGFVVHTMQLTANGWQNKGYRRDFSAIEKQVPYRIPDNIAQAIGHSNYLVGTTDVKVEKEIIWLSNPYGDPNNPYDDVMAFVHVTVPQVIVYDEFAWHKSGTQSLFFRGFANFLRAQGAPAGIVNGIDQMALTPFTADAAINPVEGAGLRVHQSPVVGSSQVAYQNGSAAAPAHPFRITIPQRSNRYSWGPWYKYNQKDGKAEVERSEQLRPEVFGGNMALLDECAFALADVSLANLYATEAGAVELAEFPRHNYAERFNENGPYITSMDVSVGIGGIQTSYQFSTWTRNFGKIAKYNIDRIARINKNKIKRLKSGISSLPAFPTKQNIASNIPQQQAADFNNTSNLFFHGTMIPSVPNLSAAAIEGGQSTWSMLTTDGSSELHILGEDVKFYNSQVKNYDIMFGCTMEQVFSPVGIRQNPTEDADDEPFPYIIKHKTPKNIEGDEDTQGKALLWEGDVRPVAKSLDPYFLPSSTDFSAVYMNNWDWFINDKSINLENYNYSPKEAASDVRTYGLRGPLLLSGWGYDMAGMPVPAQEDKMDGKFYPANPALNRGWWKTGPVDLMWDDERQVWAGGLSFVEGNLTKSIEAAGSLTDPDTSGEALIYRRKYNRGDEKYEWTDLEETVTITNRDPSLKVEAGDDIYVMLVRINYEWRVVYISCDNFAG